MSAPAIIFCAGKGTRMEDDSKNKVCFDCAGVPVIKRIVANMRQGGVDRFVIVVGHKAETVMQCLDGEPGIVYAYQKDQKGTGHAALCGLSALASIGYSGPVIISMGDKIVSSSVIAGLLEKAGRAKAVWGVQPVAANPGGGRIVTDGEKPYGIVELADAALMSLADVPEAQYAERLKEIGLNEKKAKKVIQLAKENKPAGVKRLADRKFTAREILASPYANAGLYCFDSDLAIRAIGTFGAGNAQGEIYLTDALEWFSQNSSVELYKVENADDMKTYSTKAELRKMGFSFMRLASQFISDIRAGALDGEFSRLYKENTAAQKERYIHTIETFIGRYGDKKIVITRAPGRINLMGRHIDHRGGRINVMATDRDILCVASPGEDDLVAVSNTDPAYPDRQFSIGETLGDDRPEQWLDFLDDKRIKELLEATRGDWSNYIKSAVLRAQFDSSLPLCGMDIVIGGDVPAAAGLSSSSGLVVATMEAIAALNCLNMTDREFVELCGEGEWFVGSRGGAGDHAAMKCCDAGKVTQLGFKPFTIGASANISEKYAVVVANSGIVAKKSAGSRDAFNARIASYEIVLMFLKKEFPECDLREFRDIAAIRPFATVYRMLKVVPEKLTRGGAKALLPEYKEHLERIFSNHKDPVVYDLRGVALYGISECVRSDRFMGALEASDYALIGKMMKISHNGDRIGSAEFPDELLDQWEKEDADPALLCGAYGCSTPQIDGLVDLLDGADGVLGSEIVGAGLGGCVIALAEKVKAAAIVDLINKEYYDRYGLAYGAGVFSSGEGSTVLF